MYIHLARFNQNRFTHRLLPISIAVLLSITSQAVIAEDTLPPAVSVNTITPDQFQQQRTEALRQQQLNRPKNLFTIKKYARISDIID